MDKEDHWHEMISGELNQEAAKWTTVHLASVG